MSRNTKTFKKVVDFVKEWYDTEEFLPLHAPSFNGNEKKYLNECIDSTFVSSVGKFVTEAEEKFAKAVGTKYAVAVVNGTSALHLALRVAGVQKNEEVITQPLTFVATCNAISYLDAIPVFVDVDRETLGLSEDALEKFLEENAEMRNGVCYNKTSGRRIGACLPMHTFGHPVKLDEIKKVCDKCNITLVEDAAESVGTFYKGKHTGNVGLVSAFSFNGNKTITCGGGGMIVTNDKKLAQHAKHLSTVAKTPHPYEFFHDEIGYNYRMPNINAALLVAQLEQLDSVLENKRETAEAYENFFQNIEGIKFISEPKHGKSNYWLNTIELTDKETRDEFLKYTNSKSVMTRPAWILMNELPGFKDCQVGDITNSRYLADRLVNIPSSVKN
ncbi:putative PLP-dependent enzyme possibly involved in cell wall biogenesis [Owenweeksia hongkongensis DSM 17368]|uniref:GDP-perosamine synthase n=1 Tax=Owenweeksia hongkongensis (strain DSM 17368 / CIP 108786 / JCM 12287 / NRRL B-23963 / UST20020801) TaxID=926562 RepID=G8R7P2_OWEHD|nr:LegC family aminotransferase [Owenweeksia hongkongensis]AEV32395.1 putative PLP-dependent enzyme possibly involved in cell wall biogenesis [Owenweeksia hongkongensis DSM 17368]